VLQGAGWVEYEHGLFPGGGRNRPLETVNSATIYCRQTKGGTP
jgi:hypothetical protein